MNVLDTLALESVSVDSRNPIPFVNDETWDVQALYFNANQFVNGANGDLRFENEWTTWASESEKWGAFFCLWVNVPRDKPASQGRAWADKVSQAVTHFGGTGRVDAVMFDNEKVPLDFQFAYISRWDELRPWRDTLYSVEPAQNEAVNLYSMMLARNEKSIPALGRRVRKITFQCYQGGMQPLNPLSVRNHPWGTVRQADDDLCPTIDPARPASYITSAAACGLKGLMLFSAERMPA